MVDWLKALTKKPGIAHLLRANERFNGRQGSQFGAAITYFSVLALVPIVMLAFSILGFVLVVARPDLLGNVRDLVAGALGNTGDSTSKQILDLIENALQNYAAIGIIGLLSAMYSGAGWVGNLKEAVRAQWRENFDREIGQENFFLKTLANLGILLGLLVAIMVTFAVASISTSLSDNIITFAGLDDVGWVSPVLRLVPVIVSIGAGWLFFMYLYLVLPDDRGPWRSVRRGALIGAVGLALLQYLTTFLVGTFAGTPAAALFGPIITLMLFFNLFARLILFMAAWIATAEQPAFAPQPEFNTEGPTGARAGAGRETETDPSLRQPGMVSQHIAEKTVRIGMRTGYVTGAATGIGFGAIFAYLLSLVRNRRKK